MSGPLTPGALVAGRYRLDRLIGQGGMGQVWAATHDVTLRKAALKFLKGPTHLQPDLRKRFLREARAASAVEHPNVVEIRDFFELDDGTPVMVMDLLEGETLGQRLQREGSLSIAAAAEVMLPVVSAVGTAHARGIVHRDLKPDNVFLSRSPGGKLTVRVLDFGIAKLSSAHDVGDLGALTETGTMLGTPCYMSPEQGFGERDIDHRTDIWALGVMLYESLSGMRPVDGDNMGQVIKRLTMEGITPLEVVAPDLPGEVTALVGRMLSRDREGRPSDLREVQAVLARHGGPSVPTFGAAASERPLVDSGHSSPDASPGIPSGTATTDPHADTHAVAGTPRLDTAGAQSLSVRGTKRRSAPLALAFGLATAGGLLAVVLSRGRPADPAPSGASVAAPVPPSPPVQAALVSSGASPELPAKPSPSPTAERAEPPKPRTLAAQERAREATKKSVPPAASAAPLPPSVPPKPSVRSKRGGLVDEPPF